MRVAGHVHQDVAQRAVDQPRRHITCAPTFTHCVCFSAPRGGARSLGRPGAARAINLALAHDFLQRDFQLIHLVVAGFVHARGLAGRANEHAAEQVAQRRVVVPVQKQAGQQFGATQERAVGRRGATHHHMVTAAGAGVAAIGHEFFCGQARLESGLVQKLGVRHQFAPVVRGVDVDFDDAGIGRDLQEFQARIERWRVAFHHDAHLQFAGCGLHGGDQIQIILHIFQWRHEDVEHALYIAFFKRRGIGLGAVGAARVTHFHTQRGAHHMGVRLELASRCRAWRDSRGGCRSGCGRSCSRRFGRPCRRGARLKSHGGQGRSQGCARGKRVLLDHVHPVGRCGPWQGVQG